MFAVVADQPCGEVGLLSELTTGSLATLLDTSPVRLTWANGLLALATDVAAGLAYLHRLGESHGRLFLFNVMVTSAWRAKLSEYALDRYLAFSYGGLGTSGGCHSLPLAQGKHGEQLPASSALYLPPEKSSGKMSRTSVQPQRLLAPELVPRAGRRSVVARAGARALVSPVTRRSTTDTNTQADSRASSVRSMRSVSNVDQSSEFMVAADAEAAAEAAKEKARLAEQRGDAWAFGCLLASLALHQKRAKDDSKAGRSRSGATAGPASDHGHQRGAAAHASSWSANRVRRLKLYAAESAARRGSDDMDGWEEYESVSKDRPGRCVDHQSSQLKLSAAEAAAEGRPRGRRKELVERKFEALSKLSHTMSLQRRSSEECRRAEESCTAESSTLPGMASASDAATPLPSAPPSLPSAPPSPPAPLPPPSLAVTAGLSPRWLLTASCPSTKVRGSDSGADAPTAAGSGSAQSCVLEQKALTAKAVEKVPLAPPTPYLLMRRVCQGKVSPLDGVTPSCCPRLLLQLATQCCALAPQERPNLTAVLEQLQGKVLLSIDSSALAGARRPLPSLEGWRDAAERTLLVEEPTDEQGGERGGGEEGNGGSGERSNGDGGSGDGGSGDGGG